METKSTADQSVSMCNACASNGACLDDDFFTVVRVKHRLENLGRKVGRKEGRVLESYWCE